MFKFVLLCVILSVATSLPVPDEVRKTANIQKTSEYFLTAESKPPAPKSTGLTRPSPINPNIASDPKPQEKIIPASLTDAEHSSKSAVQPTVVTVTQPKVQSSISSRTPARTVNSERHVAESTSIDSTKVPAPTVQAAGPTVVRSADTNNKNSRPTVVVSNPAAHLESNPSIASPAAPAKSTQPIIVGVEKKVVKRESSSAKHADHEQDSSSSDSDSSSHKSDNKNNNKPSKLSQIDNDDNYDRDNQPPKYVHPVPVTQIIKDLPPAQIHHPHQDAEE